MPKTETSNQIVETILTQIGGSTRLSIMVDAKDFMACDEGRTLQFKFKGCRKANCIQITLNSLDLYDVRFVKVGKINRKTFELSPTIVHSSHEGIYGDMLVELFEKQTGLYLSM